MQKKLKTQPPPTPLTQEQKQQNRYQKLIAIALAVVTGFCVVIFGILVGPMLTIMFGGITVYSLYCYHLIRKQEQTDQ
ncbi:MAG: hypothetical protein FWF66_00740 [Candidatus Bathyarchaeota archaeon]|nr:hypothetical protein [Candidatus Termiticorpusculum sp.]